MKAHRILILVLLIFIPIVLTGDFSIKQDQVCWEFQNGEDFCIGPNKIIGEVNMTSDVVFEKTLTVNGNLTINNTLILNNQSIIENIQDNSGNTWITMNSTHAIICGGC